MRGLLRSMQMISDRNTKARKTEELLAIQAQTAQIAKRRAIRARALRSQQ